MKKIINFLIVILFVLTLTVKADSGGPMFPEVQGEVKNDNVKCYEDWDLKGKTKTFSKGEVITVRYVDGKRYEYNDSEATDDIYYCYIKADDLSFGKREYKLTVDDKLSDPLDLLIVDENGSQMYSGPLTDYDKLDVVIPKGTTLKTHYKIGSYWYYVSYNDVNGYISAINDAVVYRMSSETMEKIYPVDDMDIKAYEKVGDEYKLNKVGTLPMLTEVTDYWYTDASRLIYLTHDGVTGFVESYDIFASDCTGTKVKVLNNTPVYKELVRTYINENKKMTKIKTVDANKEFDVKYCLNGRGESGYYISSLGGWLYYEYNDKNDYIETDKDGTVYDSREYKEKHILEAIYIEGYTFRFEKDAFEYNLEINENDDKLKISTLPAEDITVKITGNENLKNNSKIVISVQDDEGSKTYTINIIKRSSATVPVEEPIPAKEKDNSYIIWICLGAALLLVITTVVIIILVNKKKKNKSVEVREEIKREVPSSNVEQEREDTPKSEEDSNGLEN